MAAQKDRESSTVNSQTSESLNLEEVEDEEAEIENVMDYGEPYNGPSTNTRRQGATKKAGASQCPIVIGRAARYIPWKTMDLEGLLQELPSLQEGASKWIMEFEDKTQGKRLALGDLKAVLARLVVTAETVRVLREAGQGQLQRVEGIDDDATEFGPFRQALWTALRQEFPSRPDLSRLQGESVGQTEPEAEKESARD